MDPLDQPIAQMIDHLVEIETRCGCAGVMTLEPAHLVARMGPRVTLRIAAARLICDRCKQRPRLLVDYTWAGDPLRDQRNLPPPLPAWVLELITSSKPPSSPRGPS